MTGIDLNKWLAFGTGIGIEIGREDLTVTVVRVRPSGAKLLGAMTIPRFREQAAGEWGTTYRSFLKKLGAAHLAASVLLPRDEMTVRQVSLPGVSDKDLASAVRFEIDSLNPYSEEEAAYDWVRIGHTASILIGMTRRAILERYTTLFVEAGVKVASFTFSAAVIYSALRLLSKPAPDGLLAIEPTADGEFEVYGESAARPLFSARLDQSIERVRALAVSELRLPPETEPALLHERLPKPLAAPPDCDLSRLSLAYATALSSARLRPVLSVNLLPPEQRQQTSRLRYVPAGVLATVALILSAAAIAYPKYTDRQYLGLLHQQLQELEPQARQAADLDRQIATVRNRAQTLDNFRRHTKDDLDALKELTEILAPPVWIGTLQLTRDSLTIAGETDQAATLLKLLDSSHQVQNSAFTVPITRVNTGEVFSIHSQRKGIVP